MEPYGSENFITLLLLQKIAAEVFKLFVNVLRNGPHKRPFEIFEILKIEILTNFIRFEISLTWHPIGVKTTPPTNRSEKVFKLFLNFPSSGPHKTKSTWAFWKF